MCDIKEMLETTFLFMTIELLKIIFKDVNYSSILVVSLYAVLKVK